MAARRRLRRRPGAERSADLPLVAEWIDNPAEPPAVFVANGRRDARAGGDRSLDDRLGVVDDEQCATGRTVDRARTEAFHRRRAGCEPEGRFADGELGDNVVPVADAMQDGCAESGLVEGDRFSWSVNPKLRLDAAHPRGTLSRADRLP